MKLLILQLRYNDSLFVFFCCFLTLQLLSESHCPSLIHPPPLQIHSISVCRAGGALRFYIASDSNIQYMFIQDKYLISTRKYSVLNKGPVKIKMQWNMIIMIVIKCKTRWGNYKNIYKKSFLQEYLIYRKSKDFLFEHHFVSNGLPWMNFAPLQLLWK